MAGYDSGDWGRYAFTGIGALFVGGVISASAGHGIIALACWFAAAIIAIIWYTTLRIDSGTMDDVHRNTTAADEDRRRRKATEKALKKGKDPNDWMRVDYGH